MNFITDNNDILESIVKATYDDADKIKVESDINYEKNQIVINIFLDDSSQNIDRSKIVEVFTLLKFKVEVNIILSVDDYYTLGQLSSIISAVKGSLKRVNKPEEE